MIEFRIRWCEHFAQKLGMQDVADQAGESVTALRTIHERYTAESRYNLTPDEAATLGESLLLADELQNQSTRRELRESLHSAMAYMRKAPLTSSATLAAH